MHSSPRRAARRYRVRTALLLAALSCSAGAASADTLAADWPRLSTDQQRGTVQKKGLKRVALALREPHLRTLDTRYRVEIKREANPHHIADQKQTKRCWIFSTHAVLSSGLVKRGLPDVALSANFANYHAWRTRGRALLSSLSADERAAEVSHDALSEEGDWAPASELIEKHGMVPASVMPETVDSQNTELMTNKIRELVSAAHRDMLRTGVDRRAIEQRYAEELDALLDTTLGKPPQRFVLDGKEYTPKSYARDVLEFKPRRYVVLFNRPGGGLTWNRGYVRPANNGFAPVLSYNVGIRTMEQAARATIDGGEAVYFSINLDAANPHVVSTELSSEIDTPPAARYALHVGAFDYASIMRDHKMSKQERIDAGMYEPNHAMALVGYDFSDQRPKRTTKWKVDDSRGTRRSTPTKPSWDGHRHLYADYFRRYLHSMVVPIDALPAGLLEKLQQHPPMPLPD